MSHTELRPKCLPNDVVVQRIFSTQESNQGLHALKSLSSGAKKKKP